MTYIQWTELYKFRYSHYVQEIICHYETGRPTNELNVALGRNAVCKPIAFNTDVRLQPVSILCGAEDFRAILPGLKIFGMSQITNHINCPAILLFYTFVCG
jgi:hypothetical protein